MKAPELKKVPDFDVETELAEAGEFLIEPALPAAPKTVTRAEMMSMAESSPMAAAAHDHDDE